MHYTRGVNKFFAPIPEIINVRPREETFSDISTSRLTAGWAIRQAAKKEIGSYYALVTARVFTAFMFEGVIHRLGETLCHTWNEGQPESCPMARRGLNERHKAVRRMLEMNNSGSEYREIRPALDRLFSFRDTLAHPKVRHERLDDVIRPSKSESEIDGEAIPLEFSCLENYCIALVDRAAAVVKDTLGLGLDVFEQRFPHLKNPKLATAELAGLLHCPRSGVD
jgi:hypothetical protein